MEEIINMYNSGMSIRNIQKIVGIHRQKISNILKSNGIDVTRGADHLAIVEDFKSGISTEMLSKKYGIIEKMIIRVLNKHGIFFYKEKRILSDIEKHEIKESFYNGEKIKNLSKKYNCNIQTINEFLRSTTKESLHALSHRKNKKLPEDEILESYKNGVSIMDISSKYNTSMSVIRKLLKRNGIEIRYCGRKYSQDDNYLDKINTHEKAYFLGFFYGDGYHNAKRNEMSISIISKDRIILDYFKKQIKITRPLRIYKPYSVNQQEQTCLSFSSKQISQKLLSFGCGQQKTKELNFPDYIPKNLLNSFILGLFDADGSITINKSGSSQFSICGTYEICQGVASFFQEYGINTRLYQHKCGIYYVFVKKRALKDVYNLMYKDCEIFLPRKKNIFDLIFQNDN